ncbi:MAG: SOS response-associated peptidase family protein [Sphingomonas sp.]|nr:SOS response-associated peptidase family protein [Sphingomonas sp.]MBN8808416.1 SOS response-associated peptidase family protein [Sphingomonas sp.]
MCNLYRMTVQRWELAAYYEANDAFRCELGELEKDYVAPGRPGWVMRQHEGQRVVDQMTWGWPNPRGGKAVVNVRNYDSPFWRSALANPARRCLVPFTQFQEWTVEPDPETGKKRPHWFSIPSRAIGTFAGIWRPSEAGPIFAFLTCGYDGEAQKHVVGAIHPKAIPVMLHDEDVDRWLTAPIDDALSLACAFPSQLMAVD